MRVLVLGGTGMLGHKMFQVLSQSHDTFATVRSHNGAWQHYPVYMNVEPRRILTGIDALNPGSVAYAIMSTKPDVVVNCIGIIKQVKEAREPITSIMTNALFPHQLAELCSMNNVKLIHISTDCVFSGDKGDYTEDDIPDVCDLYGVTKALGEVIQPNCLTIRTSIIGRDFSKRTALFEWLLSNQGGKVRGYTGAIYTGFLTQTLAQILSCIIDRDISGLYHVSSTPISKYDLLVMIRDALELDIKIEPDEGFHCDRSLNSSKFQNAVDFPMPTWDEMMTELIPDSVLYDNWWKTV